MYHLKSLRVRARNLLAKILGYKVFQNNPNLTKCMGKKNMSKCLVYTSMPFVQLGALLLI
jgi:hypothetical protein